MNRVAEAMEAVRRRDFLPPDQQAHAGIDAPLPIGYGATNSQPTTVQVMLELLDPQPGEHLLDVGAGSGWTTALLARLAGPEGSVVGVERIEELVVEARTHLGDRYPTASLELADPEALGWPKEAPYDRILVSAEAKHLPAVLIEQLALEGVMVIPVDGVMLRVTRTEGQPRIEEHGRFMFVPLIE